jgi:hypothetical protein
MTAITLQARRFVEMATPKLHTVYHWFLGALDVLAEGKMRKAQYEINRCRGLFHHEHSLAAKTTAARR